MLKKHNTSFNTSTAKGCHQAQHFHNPSFSQAGICLLKNDWHITGVYATNPLEILPPLYIFTLKIKTNQNQPIIFILNGTTNFLLVQELMELGRK